LNLDEQRKQKVIKINCQKFFNEAIKNLYDEEWLDTSFLEENSELIENKFKN